MQKKKEREVDQGGGKKDLKSLHLKKNMMLNQNRENNLCSQPQLVWNQEVVVVVVVVVVIVVF